MGMKKIDAPSSPMFSKRTRIKMKQRLCTGWGTLEIDWAIRKVVDKPPKGFREASPHQDTLQRPGIFLYQKCILTQRFSLDNKNEDILSSQMQKYKPFDRNVENRSPSLSENYSKLNIHNFTKETLLAG